MPTHEVDFEELLREHLDELELHRFSKDNLRLAERVMELLFEHLTKAGVSDIRQVDEDHLASFINSLKEMKVRGGKPMALSTQSTFVSALKRFFKFLDRRSMILRNPAAHIRLPRVQRIPRFVPSVRQVERVLNVPPSDSVLGLRDRAILETYYGTGVRMGECERLNVDDIDLQKGALWVRSGKGRKDRRLPIPRKTLRALDRYMKVARPVLLHNPHQRALFLTRLGGRLGQAMLDRIIRECGKAAGLQGLHAHVLRHACATHLLQGGADIRHVQKILGHSQISTTAEYVRVYIGDLKKMVRKRHPRERQRRRQKK